MKVNYIVANYIGNNRQSPIYRKLFEIDPVYFFKKHLSFFYTNDVLDHITPTFVFNDDVEDKIKEEILSLNHRKFEIIFRKNGGYSYGIWNDVIEKNLNSFDYFFLIEDDYIPTGKEFAFQHIKKIKEDVAIVCGLVDIAEHKKFEFSVSKNEIPFPFPSISNGLITSQACKKVKEKYGTVFRLNHNNDYWSGCENQLYFSKYFTEMGYKIVDVLDEFSSPYYNAQANKIVSYGGTNPPLIEPIIFWN